MGFQTTTKAQLILSDSSGGFALYTHKLKFVLNSITKNLRFCIIFRNFEKTGFRFFYNLYYKMKYIEMVIVILASWR